MKILICGGRNYKDQETVNEVMDDVVKHINPDDITVISGHARGADQLGEAWAKSRDLSLDLYPAKWETYGKSAGPKRNIEMLNTGPDLVVAFPGGNGTAHTVRNAKERGIDVMEVTL
jgi:hypothetical protein